MDTPERQADTEYFATIGKAIRELRKQFEEAYLDDHKLIVDTKEYDQSYLKGLPPEQLRQLELRPSERRELHEDRVERKRKRKGKWKDGKRPEEDETPVRDKEPDMIVDPSEFPRILDLVHAKEHLDKAEKAFLEAFDATVPFLKKRALLDMLGHLTKLDEALGYTVTSETTGEKTMKGPLVEYKMDSKIIANALVTISETLTEHLGVKNQLAKELREDELFKGHISI
jgi:hypothetical protein